MNTKVGDKMKCVKTVFSFDDPELVLCQVGDIVTVIEVDEDNGQMVETENLAHSFFTEEGEFEIFEEFDNTVFVTKENVHLFSKDDSIRRYVLGKIEQGKKVVATNYPVGKYLCSCSFGPYSQFQIVE